MTPASVQAQQAHTGVSQTIGIGSYYRSGTASQALFPDGYIGAPVELLLGAAAKGTATVGTSTPVVTAVVPPLATHRGQSDLWDRQLLPQWSRHWRHTWIGQTIGTGSYYRNGTATGDSQGSVRPLGRTVINVVVPSPRDVSLATYRIRSDHCDRQLLLQRQGRIRPVSLEGGAQLRRRTKKEKRKSWSRGNGGRQD